MLPVLVQMPGGETVTVPVNARVGPRESAQTAGTTDRSMMAGIANTSSRGATIQSRRSRDRGKRSGIWLGHCSRVTPAPFRARDTKQRSAGDETSGIYVVAIVDNRSTDLP